MEGPTMQGATLAVLFHFVCVALASRKVKVIVHTKPPEQSEFRCHATNHRSFTIPADTYIDVLAYNSEPCTCWFRTSVPGSTVHTRVLHEGRYQCFRDFRLFRTFVEYQGCGTDRRSGYPGSMIAASSLIVRVSRQGIAVMENGTEGGLVNTSISFPVPVKELTSLRLQATSSMDLTCGIAPESSPSTDVTSPSPTTALKTQTEPRITSTSSPTQSTSNPSVMSTTPPSTHKTTTRHKTKHRTRHRTTQTTASDFAVHATTELPPDFVASDGAWDNGTWWNGTETWQEPLLVIKGVLVPVMIGTLGVGMMLVILILVVICVVNKNRSREKDDVDGDVDGTYHSVNTNNHHLHQQHQLQQSNLVSSDVYQFRPIDAYRLEENAPDHGVSVKRPRGVYAPNEDQARGDGTLLGKARGDGTLQGKPRGDGARLGNARGDGTLLGKARGDGTLQGKARGDGLLEDEACSDGVLLVEARGDGTMSYIARGDGKTLDRPRARDDRAMLDKTPRGDRTMFDKARGDRTMLDEAAGDRDLDESIATMLHDVFTEFHAQCSNMPPKFPVIMHIPE